MEPTIDKRIRVTTISLAIPHPQKIPQMEYRMRQVERYLNKAGELKSDIVCLPETFQSSFGKTPEENAEDVEGKTVEYISKKARKYKMYIIAPMYAKIKRKIFNVSFVFDRNGKIIGEYRKTHLPDEKCSAGDELPVINTDFGKIAILTCHDMNFFEVSRVYMLKGADILFWPTMWGHEDIKNYTLLYLKATALLNAVYVVSADYAWTLKNKRKKPCGSYILDPLGKVIASSGCKGGIISAKITIYRPPRRYKNTKDCYDLNPAIRRRALLKGRRPELYKIIVE